MSVIRQLHNGNRSVVAPGDFERTPSHGISSHFARGTVRSPDRDQSVLCRHFDNQPTCAEYKMFSQQVHEKGTGAQANGALGEPVCDSSGYAVFSDGEAGAMHVMAHRMLDSGQIALGHRRLGEWLACRRGSGSKWIHLQWHMAIFEVALGDWQCAIARFRQYILPAVVTSYDALTDAPAFLWRLSLEAGRHLPLPWEPVRIRALSSMQGQCPAYVNVHNLLALAGARDVGSLDKWLAQQTQKTVSRAEAVVIRIAKGLKSYVEGSYDDAATQLANAVPQVAKVGGSRAQNELFTKLHEAASRRASTENGYAELAQAA